ncbi:MAG: UDP-N-acetylmuramoylalanyl-D-glutamyl-2,6-diaminopimelate--D-alanyl-D-alanine ligase [Hyphomicrobiaceae bacterium]
MTDALWRWDELVAAAGGKADGATESALTGFSIDTRTLAPGEVFVALRAERDGHEFVSGAFERGAAAALVRRAYVRNPGDGALIRVDDSLHALGEIGRAARARLKADARVIAVTGSAGKTGTKEMLRACLSQAGRVHAAEKSFNNHWGVPLTLARMPADVRFAVFEIGMNHAGEITPLSLMVRPHVTIITNVLPVHLGQFASEEAIAEAKAEIFAGLEPAGIAILNRDNRHYYLLERKAQDMGGRVVSFGRTASAQVRATAMEPGPDGTQVTAVLSEGTVRYTVGAPGLHLAGNSLAVAAVLDVLDVAPEALAALAGVAPPQGRGARTTFAVPGGAALLIDESYNANPASMRAALAALATVPREAFARRIAVMGDMLELGPAAGEFHQGLKDAVDAAGVDQVFACGPNMRLLFDSLPATMRALWCATSDELAPNVAAVLKAGDAVMIKGSLGTRMAPIVEAVKAHLGGKAV